MLFIDFGNNTPSACAAWEQIAEFFDMEVSDMDVWEIARESKTIPLFHNIYMNNLLAGIVDGCMKYCDNVDFISYDVNSIASSLSINGEIIITRDDFFGLLAKHLLTDLTTDDLFDIDIEFKFGETTFEVGTSINDIWHHIEEEFNITIGNYIGA